MSVPVVALAAFINEQGAAYSGHCTRARLGASRDPGCARPGGFSRARLSRLSGLSSVAREGPAKAETAAEKGRPEDAEREARREEGEEEVRRLRLLKAAYHFDLRPRRLVYTSFAGADFMPACSNWSW